MITTRTHFNGAVIEVKGVFPDDAKKTVNDCLEEILLRHVDDLTKEYKNKTKIELDKP